MIKAGYGQSTEQNTKTAFAEAARAAIESFEAEELEIVFLFGSGVHATRIESGIQAAVEASGCENIVGCSGMSVLSIEAELEQTAGVVALAVGGEAVDAIPFIVPADEAVERLELELEAHTDETGLLCLFPTISAGNPAEIVQRLSASLGFPIVGAAASCSPMDSRTYQWLGEDVRSDAVAGALLKGNFEILTGVAQGCQPFGQAYTITKADNNVIHELAFVSAIDALKEALDELTPAQKENVGPAIFAGIAMDEYDSERRRGDFLIRNLIGMNPEDGSIAIGEHVEVGQTIQFNRRTPDAAHADLEQTTAALRERLLGRDPAFGLYFNCLGRGFGLYGQPDHDIQTIRSDIGAFPLIGFFGNAEFAPVGGRNFVHSYTGGLVVFTESERLANGT